MDNLNSHVAGDDGGGSASKEKPGHWWATDYGIRDWSGYICQIIVPSSFQGQEERHEREVAERAAAIQLMTAAPDLLEALQHLMLHEKRGRIMPIGREWDAARAAVAKAVGGAV